MGTSSVRSHDRNIYDKLVNLKIGDELFMLDGWVDAQMVGVNVDVDVGWSVRGGRDGKGVWQCWRMMKDCLGCYWL